MELNRPVPRPETQRCPYCRDVFSPKERRRTCGQCQALHHDDCWREGGGCSSCVRSEVARPDRRRLEFTPEALEERRARRRRRRRQGQNLLALTVIAVLFMGLVGVLVNEASVEPGVTYRSGAGAPWARTVQLRPDVDAEVELDDPPWRLRFLSARGSIVVVDKVSGVEVTQLDMTELRKDGVTFAHEGHRYTAMAAERFGALLSRVLVVTFTRSP